MSDNFNFLGPDECFYNSPEEYLWTGVLELCGCYSESLFNLTIDILKRLYLARLENQNFYYDYKDKTEAETDLQELILHILDSKKLIDHAGSVRGSWLSDNGVDICKLIWNEKPI